MADTLANISILDFSRVLAGPFATMILGDLGAEVIKVERPGSGDETRAWGPPWDAQGEATYYQAVNRNKRGVIIDLASPAGLARARSLAADTNVIVENFRPGVMDKLGLGYDELSARHDALIYCSITGFGAGAGAMLPGYDLLVQAVGGLMSITGEANGEPQKVGVALVDVLAGLFAAVGILAAVRHRERTGEGQRVEINLLHTLLAALANQASGYTVAGAVPRRMGNAHPSISPYDLYRAADRELALAVGNDRQFGALCSVLGVPELVQDPRFVTNTARVHHRGQLREELEHALARRPAQEWVDQLTDAHVPAGVVNDISAAFELAEGLGLRSIVSIPREDQSVVRLPSNPIGLSRTPARYRCPPPRFADLETPGG